MPTAAEMRFSTPTETPHFPFSSWLMKPALTPARAAPSRVDSWARSRAVMISLPPLGVLLRSSSVSAGIACPSGTV